MAITKTYDLLNINGVKGWVRDSWARRAIAALQQRVAGIVVPTKTSELTNDSGYITSADVPPGSTASSTTPLMDGTAAVGTENAFARGDHRHPADTSKQDALTSAQLSAVNSGATADDFAINDASVLCTITPIEPTLTNGSHNSTYGGCWYYKRGCTVTVHIGVTGLTASTDTTIFTLPAGYRPRSVIGFVGNATSTTNYGRARIGTDGAVHANSTSTRMVAQVTFDAFS